MDESGVYRSIMNPGPNFDEDQHIQEKNELREKIANIPTVKYEDIDMLIEVKKQMDVLNEIKENLLGTPKMNYNGFIGFVLKYPENGGTLEKGNTYKYSMHDAPKFGHDTVQNLSFKRLRNKFIPHIVEEINEELNYLKVCLLKMGVKI